MDTKTYNNLPQGTTLYFVSIDAINPTQIEIDHIKKGHTEPKSPLGLSLVPMLSTTKRGALANAISNYQDMLEFYTKVLSTSIDELKKYL